MLIRNAIKFNVYRSFDVEMECYYGDKKLL